MSSSYTVVIVQIINALILTIERIGEKYTSAIIKKEMVHITKNNIKLHTLPHTCINLNSIPTRKEGSINRRR